MRRAGRRWFGMSPRVVIRDWWRGTWRVDSAVLLTLDGFDETLRDIDACFSSNER